MECIKIKKIKNYYEKAIKNKEYLTQPVGKLDKVERLLKDIGSERLVLIEESSEILSRIKDLDGFIEIIFERIIEENKSDFTILGSYTMPYVLRKTDIVWKDFDEVFYKDDKSINKYISKIEDIRSKFKDRSILHIGADLTIGGHYGIIIFLEGKAIVFDSMQFNGLSSYTRFFTQIALDVADITIDDIIILKTPDRETCPQFTGGFITTPENNKDYIVKIQDVDSQNHFCYFWSILYFHIFITKGMEGIENVFNNLRDDCILPLTCIKRYIWSVVNSYYNTDKFIIQLFSQVYDEPKIVYQYFKLYFRQIWINIEENEFKPYFIIDSSLKEIRNMNINKCLNYALRSSTYIESV